MIAAVAEVVNVVGVANVDATAVAAGGKPSISTGATGDAAGVGGTWRDSSPNIVINFVAMRTGVHGFESVPSGVCVARRQNFIPRVVLDNLAYVQYKLRCCAV